MKNALLLRKIADITILAVFVVGVLGIFPFFDNFLYFSKYLTLTVGTLVTAVLYVLYTLAKRTIEIKISPLTVPLFFFGLAAIASSFFTNAYPVEALLGLGGAYISLSLLSLFAGSIVTEHLPKKLLFAAGFVGVVLTIGIGTQFIGFGPVQLLNALFSLSLPSSAAFSVAGGSFFALQVLVITCVGIIAEIVAHKRIEKWMLVVLPILIVGVLLHVWTILPGKDGALVSPSWAASWSIALDSIRQPKAALIGGGAASYGNYYLRFKPVWLNSLSTWNIPFTQASNLPFTLIVTMGFFGLGSWLLLAWQSVRMFRSYTGTAKTMSAMLVSVFILQLCFPTSITILVVQAVLFVAAFAARTEKLPVFKLQALTMSMEVESGQTHSTSAQKASFPVYIVSTVLLAGIAFSGYYLGRFTLSEMHSMEASKAISKNDIVTAYEQQQQAIQLNPYSDVLRRNYALTNLFIASSLSTKADISDAEKSQVAELLQQAVREARTATMLDDLDVENWGVLARMYQNMIGVADQSDQFAVQAYVQAINTDPTNPSLRLALGGLFLEKKQYQQAASIFKQAVDIKQDLPNAQYNLAYTLEKLEAHADAQAVYKNLLTLLESTGNTQTAEYAKVKEEYDAVTKLVDAAEKAAAKNAPAQTGTPAQGTKTTPSILDQNIDTTSSEVPTQPTGIELSPDQQTRLSQEVASPSPSPAP